MKKFLEKIVHTVLPHEKNKNIPHLLREECVIVMSFLIIALFVFNQNNWSIIRGLHLTGTVYPAVLADLTNENRASVGVPELSWSNDLENAAKLKAEDMIANAYFAHTSPRGLTPWFWLQEVSYDFIYAGENLAVDFTESVKVQNAWLDSPTHKANLLNSNFTEIGITAVDGKFEGRNTTFIVQFFGKPAAKTAQASTTVEIESQPKPAEATTTSEVAGASAEIVNTEIPKKELPVKIIEETEKLTNKFISVQNLTAVNESAEEKAAVLEKSSKHLSTWYARLIINPTNTIKMIYNILLTIILAAMTLMLSKEYQRHHLKHLMMGLMLVFLIGASMYFLNYPLGVST